MSFCQKFQDNYIFQISYIEGMSRTPLTSGVGLRVALANGLPPLTGVAKCSFLDVTQTLDPPVLWLLLENVFFTMSITEIINLYFNKVFQS